jgi:hypothetical protein
MLPSYTAFPHSGSVVIKAAGILTVLVAIAAPQSATENLINGDARRGAQGWTSYGDATIETFQGVPSFTVRQAASFSQEVMLVDRAAGMYAAMAMVGQGQSDRINSDGSITDLPYLYATIAREDRKRFLAYWQGQNMLARPASSTQWVPMSGVFRIPEGARYVYVLLGQAERKGSPHDGSAARFADVRLHLFPSEGEARAFVDRYTRP